MDMNSTTVLHRLIRLVILFIFSVMHCWAEDLKDDYFFQRIDYQQGLSNSSVLCLFQDSEGLMWFGTYDGVNCWDGKTMEVFRSDFSGGNTLSNNVIHSISQADDNCLWITTHLGGNRLSRMTRQVVSNYDFDGNYFVQSNSLGNTWVISSRFFYYYNTCYHKFCKIHSHSLPIDSMENRTFVTDDGKFWVFPPNSGEIHQYSIGSFDGDSTGVSLSVSVNKFHPKGIKNIFYQNGIFCFIDSDKDLYMYDISRKSKIYIRNLMSLEDKYGKIAGITPFFDDVIVAFLGNGLIRLRSADKYEETVVDRNIRIYSTYWEPRHGLLWVASDGQGAVIYAKKYTMANNWLLNDLSSGLSRQVRSIFTDKYGGLWFGTKGDGLVHLPYYQNYLSQASPMAKVYSCSGVQSLGNYVKWDREFHVFKMLQSRYMDGFWIGAGKPGLHYYSFKDDKVHYVPISEGEEEPVSDIHDIYEFNDTTLFVVSGVQGFYRINLQKAASGIGVYRQKHYRFFYEQQEINMFYPMLAEGDSILWLGSRQKGLIRFDLRTEEYHVISLKERLHKSVDDILSLCRAHDGKLYVGTTSGLVQLTFHGSRFDAVYIGREEGLLNDMIHGVLEDKNGYLWLGTNRGLIKYNPKNRASHDYYYTGGVKVGEFSDDAYYVCPYTGSLFFGGVNGFLALDGKAAAVPDYRPSILLRYIWIGRNKIDLGKYYDNKAKKLTLHGSELSFSVAFAVPNFQTGDEVEYSFMLEGYDKDWSSFGGNEVTYNNVPSGSYQLKVRYKKDVFDTDYKYFTMQVQILPPWYRSIWAYGIYLLVLIGMVAYVLMLLKRYFRNERMLKRLLDAENGESVDRSCGISGRSLLHQFTLIYDACGQLCADNLSPEQRKKQVNIIRETMLDTLFRPDVFSQKQITHFYPDVFALSAYMDIRELSSEVLTVLSAEGEDLSGINIDIPDNIVFPVYQNALRCVLYCCFDLLCKQGTQVEVGAEIQHDDSGSEKMLLSFAAPYDILSEIKGGITGASVEPLDKKKGSRLFELQLLISSIRVVIDRLHVEVDLRKADEGNLSTLTLSFIPAQLSESETDSGKKLLLLLEDREEMAWLITGILSSQFNVKVVKNIQAAFEIIRHDTPTVFMVDMGMYANAESTLMECVNRNRSSLSKTAFIPMLAWETSFSIQRELMLWSDSYIVLPYDVLFLREVVHKAVYGKREAKQIYLEDLGEWANQFVCVNEEQVAFLRKLLSIIEQNLGREDFGVNLLADRMAMSPRQFYRRFKEISSMAPTDLIKNYRMEKAARILVESPELSIQEVIDEIGISSRSYFYKEFTRLYGMTPKDYRDQMLDKEQKEN